MEQNSRKMGKGRNKKGHSSHGGHQYRLQGIDDRERAGKKIFRGGKQQNHYKGLHKKIDEEIHRGNRDKGTIIDHVWINCPRITVESEVTTY